MMTAVDIQDGLDITAVGSWKGNCWAPGKRLKRRKKDRYEEEARRHMQPSN